MKKFKFDKNTENLFNAIMGLKSVKEAEMFFRDLCTPAEIKAMSERWQIANLLNRGLTYRDIADILKVSSTTVSRVATWLFNGEGGYRLALKKMSHHNNPSFGKRLR